VIEGYNNGHMPRIRTNGEWLEELGTPGPERDVALADLHAILSAGLQRGVLSQVETAAPEFAALAGDFAQEALLKILDSLESFEGRSQFTTWAHKIAVNIALTELRRKRWKDPSLDQLTETEDGEYTPSFLADEGPKPENAAERREMLHTVRRLIMEELTEKQRTGLLMLVIDGRSPNEVAEVMDMKPNAVYKLLHDARLRLKDRLAREGLTPEEVIGVFE
jgi:RNA polymerase sigma-70 factor (ECF subfamily)